MVVIMCIETYLHRHGVFFVRKLFFIFIALPAGIKKQFLKGKPAKSLLQYSKFFEVQ